MAESAGTLPSAVGLGFVSFFLVGAMSVDSGVMGSESSLLRLSSSPCSPSNCEISCPSVDGAEESVEKFEDTFRRKQLSLSGDMDAAEWARLMVSGLFV